MNCRAIEAIIIKDMSRLGRDYLKVGQVMEILRQRYKPQNLICFQIKGHERQAHDRASAIRLPLGR